MIVVLAAGVEFFWEWASIGIWRNHVKEKSIKSWQGAMLLAGLEGEKVEAAKQLGSHLALALRLDLVRLRLRLKERHMTNLLLFSNSLDFYN